MDAVRNLARKLGYAVYALIALVAIILYLIALPITDDSLHNLLIGLSSSLIAVAVVFFLVKIVFGHSSDELIDEKIMSRLSEVTMLPSRDSIYHKAIDLIKGNQWKMVRIFAPVGVWRPDELKAEWLNKLANAAKSGTVTSVSGVFGLPPMMREGKPILQNEVIQYLTDAKKVLAPLNKLKNVELHFYPPCAASVGVGVINFENNAGKGSSSFALACQEHEEVIDTAFAIDNDEIFRATTDWFDKHVWGKATRSFILQDSQGSFLERWDEIVKVWYGFTIDDKEDNS